MRQYLVSSMLMSGWTLRMICIDWWPNVHPILQKKKRVDSERSLIWSVNSCARCVMANLNCSEGVCKNGPKKASWGWLPPTIRQWSVYFQRLMAMDLQEYLIFGRVSLLKIDAYIVVESNIHKFHQLHYWTEIIYQEIFFSLQSKNLCGQKENIVVSQHQTHTTSIMFFRFLLQIPNKYLTRNLEAIPDINKFNVTRQK